MRAKEGIQTILFATLAVVVLLSVKRSKGFPALKAGHVYQVTVATDKTDDEVNALMAELKSAYGETWVGFQRLDQTHVQWSFVADQDEPAPTIPGDWASKTTVDDLGPRVLV